MDVTVVLPCLNEEESVGLCVKKCFDVFEKSGIKGEVVVVDNNCTDRTAEIAKAGGARVVSQTIAGYGAAYIKGLSEASGTYLVMADADDTYDFYDIPRMIFELERGAEMVLASRFMGKMADGAMSFSHRYIGNPILTGMLNVCFGAHLSDCHTGFRAFPKSVFVRFDLRTTGMEFASEMIVAALREKTRIVEIPTTYRPRIGESKLNGIVDAWRHVRFMLMFSPDWLFVFPGSLLFFGGLLCAFLSGFRMLTIAGHRFDLHGMIAFSFAALLGSQVLTLGVLAKNYGITQGFVKKDAVIDRALSLFNLERGLAIGALVAFVGFSLFGYVIWLWAENGFGTLGKERMLIVAGLLICFGVHAMFSSFFLSMLGIRRIDDRV